MKYDVFLQSEDYTITTRYVCSSKEQADHLNDKYCNGKAKIREILKTTPKKVKN